MSKDDDSRNAPTLTLEQQQEVRAKLPDSTPDLGEIREIHKVDHMAPPWVWWIGAVFVLLLAGALLKLGLSKPPGDEDRPVIFVLASVLAATSLGLTTTGVVLLFFLKATSASRYVYCKGGLIHARGGDVDAIPWTELELKKTNANPFNRGYELRGQNGGDPIKLRVNPLRGKMIKNLQTAQIRFALPKLLKALEACQTLKFGCFDVSREGLVHRKKSIPWNRIKALNFSYDQNKTRQLFLEVETLNEGKINVNASKDLANLWLFMELAVKLEPSLRKFKDSQDSWLW